MEHEDLEQITRRAFAFGKADAEGGARWEHSLEQHLWGTVLPDFSLEQRAALLRAYGEGWVATGRALPSEHAVP